ncbi:hypothetical protein ACSSVY_001250 [Roseovarius sp. MBR-51]
MTTLHTAQSRYLMMQSALVNVKILPLRTMFVLQPDEMHKRIGSETLVVCGAPRGGTSIVSYTLFNLGYFIGDDLGPHNYEDKEMLHAVPAKFLMQVQLPERPAYKELIKRRNQQNTRWGFKLPRATEYVPELISTLRNPVFVVCVRNPLAVVRSIFNREADFGDGFAEAIQIARSYQNAMDDLISRSDTPAIFIDMDTVKTIPGVFLEEFSSLLRLKGNLLSIKDAISTPGYKESEKRTASRT